MDYKDNSLRYSQCLWKHKKKNTIVPWVYEEARRYYYNQWLLSQKNAEKDIEAYVPKVKEITIKPPKREPKKRKLFIFLDEEGAEDCGK